jgi:hypothetical protein
MRQDASLRGGLAVAVLASSLAAATASSPALGQTTAKPAAPPSTPAAKPAPPPQDEDEDVPEVKVTARRLPQVGQVVGDIKPELQLSPADIQSYGVSTVTELLNELAPETRSDRGRGGETPVVLLNGRRISSFNEIQNIPTEAILRVDILPEEVSLKYGYTADQRVVNIVLRRRFRAITGELLGGETTEGGHEQGQAEADLFHVRGDSRLNLDLKYQGADQLTEAQRGLASDTTGAPYDRLGNIVSPTHGAQIDPALSALVGEPVTVAGVPASAAAGAPPLSAFAPTANVANVTDTSQDRTLLPATQSITANAVLAQPIFWGINATVNGTLGATSSDSLQGLPGFSLLIPNGDPFSPFGEPVTLDRYAGSPLAQSVDGWTAHLGSTLNRDVGDWRVSLTDAYDHADSSTRTDAGFDTTAMQALLNADSPSFNPFAPIPATLLTPLAASTARSLSDSANIQVLANGPLLKLPAGSLYISAKLGDTESLQSSRSLRLGSAQSVSLSRNDANALLNLDLPIASASHHFLPIFGELSANLNTAVDQLSDFGLLKTLGYGLNWTPIPGYNLIVSHTNDHQAPTIQQLGGPTVLTPGVRLFDYTTGQTVDVTQLSGANPALKADNRNVFKVGLTLKPIPTQDFTITASYIDSHIDNPIATFPAASAAIEAAFPDRFIRNSEGELTEEDDRPVNFASQERKEIRWGFNYSRPVGPQPQPRFNRAAFRPNGQTPRRRPDGSSVEGPPAGAEGAPAAASGDQAANGSPAAGDANRPGPPPGGGGGGGGRGGGGRFGGFGGGQQAGGRFQIAIYHTIFFQDQILVRPGGPTLDLLNGAPASSTGGQPGQEVEGQLGFTLNGFGARISADWKSATTVQGGTTASTGELYFSDITTINFRLFDNLGQQRAVVQRFPILRGTRITLYASNLFDDRIRVRENGAPTPLIYQPAYLDPAGRTITLSLRKLFY